MLDDIVNGLVRVDAELPLKLCLLGRVFGENERKQTLGRPGPLDRSDGVRLVVMASPRKSLVF